MKIIYKHYLLIKLKRQYKQLCKSFNAELLDAMKRDHQILIRLG